jgi:tetratricopeptide (TPR) repeat protein
LLSKEAGDTLESRYPNSARAHQSIGENYAVLRRIPEAVQEYQAALKLRPDTPGLHLALGQIYAGEKDWTKAEEAFRAETKIQPGDAESAYRYGNALLQQGKTQEARTALQRADQLQPNMPETLYALGKADSLTGNAAAAEKAWRQLLSIEKDTSLAAQTHFGLATLYRKQRKAAEAAHEMEAYQKIQAANSQQQ